jgi:tetratricopeptide (TPR) repeat protein
VLLILLYRNRNEEALANFNTVLISPLPSFARHWNGERERERERKNERERAMGRENRSFHLFLFFFLLIAYGCVLQYFNRHREAVERFNRAMQMQPNVVDYHRHRAKSLAALGKLDEGIGKRERRRIRA